jgi:hypothetical protein
MMSRTRQIARSQALLRQAEQLFFEELDFEAAERIYHERNERMRFRSCRSPEWLAGMRQQSRVRAAAGDYKMAWLLGRLYCRWKFDPYTSPRDPHLFPEAIRSKVWLLLKTTGNGAEARLREALGGKGALIADAERFGDATTHVLVGSELRLALAEWLLRQKRVSEAILLLRQIDATMMLPDSDECKRLARAYLAHPEALAVRK